MADNTLSPLVRAPRVVAAATGALLIETGSLRGQRFLLPLAPSSLVLGRDASCGVSFPSELDADRLMGRRHAQIDVRADGVYLIDLHSANGTFIQQADGQVLPVASEVRLGSGSRIALGGEDGTWITIELVPEAGAPRESAPSHEAPTMRFPPGSLAAMGSAVHVEQPVAWQPPAAKEPAAGAAHAGAVSREVIPTPLLGESPVPSALSRQPASPAAYVPPSVPSLRRAQESAAVVPDQEQRQQRRILVQQLVVILGLLVLGCGVGLLLGMRGSEEPPAAVQ